MLSLEKSKNVLEEKRRSIMQKICTKKNQHVYNSCYELRSRTIKKSQAKDAQGNVKQKNTARRIPQTTLQQIPRCQENFLSNQLVPTKRIELSQKNQSVLTT